MEKKSWGEFAFAGLLLFICIFSVNNWSLWLDESSTAILASIPSFKGFVEKLSVWTGSESQMPLYIGCMWAWEKLAGHTEYALRFFNVVMALIGICYCAYSAKRMKKSDAAKVKVAMALMVITPFFIYNMNEARVNISLCVLSALCYVGIYMYGKYQSKIDLYICVIALIIGCGFNMLFFFVAPILLVMGLSFDKKIISKNIAPFTIGVIGCVAIGCYYLWTLMQSKGGMVERPGLSNIAYSLYEFMGFNGMGAPKNEIRESEHLIATIKPYIPWMLALCVSYALLAWRMIVEKAFNKTLWIFIGGLLLFVIGAYVASFRFWGRHLFIFYPLWIYTLSSVIYDLWADKRIINRAVVTVFILMIIVSSIRIACLNQYKKENVKETVAFVNNLAGMDNQDVYFAGFDELANYYGLKNQQNLKNMEKADNGILVFIKSMKVFYGGSNIYYQPEKYEYELIRSNSTSDIYQFKKK